MKFSIAIVALLTACAQANPLEAAAQCVNKRGMTCQKGSAGPCCKGLWCVTTVRGINVCL